MGSKTSKLSPSNAAAPQTVVDQCYDSELWLTAAPAFITAGAVPSQEVSTVWITVRRGSTTTAPTTTTTTTTAVPSSGAAEEEEDEGALVCMPDAKSPIEEISLVGTRDATPSSVLKNITLVGTLDGARSVRTATTSRPDISLARTLDNVLSIPTTSVPRPNISLVGTLSTNISTPSPSVLMPPNISLVGRIDSPRTLTDAVSSIALIKTLERAGSLPTVAALWPNTSFVGSPETTAPSVEETPITVTRVIPVGTADSTLPKMAPQSPLWLNISRVGSLDGVTSETAVSPGVPNITLISAIDSKLTVPTSSAILPNNSSVGTLKNITDVTEVLTTAPNAIPVGAIVNAPSSLVLSAPWRNTSLFESVESFPTAASDVSLARLNSSLVNTLESIPAVAEVSSVVTNDSVLSTTGVSLTMPNTSNTIVDMLSTPQLVVPVPNVTIVGTETVIRSVQNASQLASNITIDSAIDRVASATTPSVLSPNTTLLRAIDTAAPAPALTSAIVAEPTSVTEIEAVSEAAPAPASILATEPAAMSSSAALINSTALTPESASFSNLLITRRSASESESTPTTSTTIAAASPLPPLPSPPPPTLTISISLISDELPFTLLLLPSPSNPRPVPARPAAAMTPNPDAKNGNRESEYEYEDEEAAVLESAVFPFIPRSAQGLTTLYATPTPTPTPNLPQQPPPTTVTSGGASPVGGGGGGGESSVGAVVWAVGSPATLETRVLWGRRARADRWDR